MKYKEKVPIGAFSFVRYTISYMENFLKNLKKKALMTTMAVSSLITVSNAQSGSKENVAIPISSVDNSTENIKKELDFIKNYVHNISYGNSVDKAGNISPENNKKFDVLLKKYKLDTYVTKAGYSSNSRGFIQDNKEKINKFIDVFESTYIKKYEESRPLTFNEKKELPAIHVSDPNDPRLKKYQDSLDLYNLSTKGNFDTRSENLENAKYSSFLPPEINKHGLKPYFEDQVSNSDIGVYGSKIEYSKTKKPLNNDFNESIQYRKNQQTINMNDVDYKTYKGKNPFIENKPVAWENRVYYGSDYLRATTARKEVNGKWYYTDPTTSKIENSFDRKELKKIFPQLTDKEIDEYVNSIGKIESKDKYPSYKYIKKGTSVDDLKKDQQGGRVTTKHWANNLNEGYQFESIVPNIYKEIESIPIYIKPIQPFILDIPKKEETKKQETKKIEELKKDIVKKITEAPKIKEKITGPYKYTTKDGAGNIYHFMVDSSGVSKSLKVEDYDSLNYKEVKWEDIK